MTFSQYLGLEEHLVDFFPVSVEFSLRKARWVAFGEVGSGKNLWDVYWPNSNIFKLLNQTTDVLVDYIWIWYRTDIVATDGEENNARSSSFHSLLQSINSIYSWKLQATLVNGCWRSWDMKIALAEFMQPLDVSPNKPNAILFCWSKIW